MSRELYLRVREWEKRIRDPRDAYPYRDLLSELSFQSELRFCDYVQYADEGSFLTRLEAWLTNMPQAKQQRALLQLLPHIIFIDELQMTAIYRDAFRRVIGPWLGASSFSIDQFLAADFAEVQRRALRDYQIVSITESFNLALLLNANDLHGLPRPFVLGLNKELARSKIRELMSDSKIKGCVVCEDVVGTGKQAGKMLQVIEDTSPPDWRILFVPLIAFESGLENIQSRYVTRTIVKPIVVLPKVRCLTGKPQPEEPELFKLIRGIVNSTAERVATPYGVADDPPSNPFGYEGSGGLIVTCHNAPNNTLPLIHHRAPTWRALFRRLHHTERSE